MKVAFILTSLVMTTMLVPKIPVIAQVDVRMLLFLVMITMSVLMTAVNQQLDVPTSLFSAIPDLNVLLILVILKSVVKLQKNTVTITMHVPMMNAILLMVADTLK
jgi:hypothetical protein